MDDLLLTLMNPQISLPNLHALLDAYEALSGYKLNPTKSEALSVNCRHNVIQALRQTFQYTWQTDHLTYLGTNMTTCEKLCRANCAPLFRDY